MTEFTKKKFSVAVGSDAYRENWERAFGKKEERAPSLPPLDPEVRTIIEAMLLQAGNFMHHDLEDRARKFLSRHA